MRQNEDGDLIFRRKKAASVAGDKRKHAGIMEQPNKRSAIEGRNFAPLRARRAMPTGDHMEIDGPASLPASHFPSTM
ncbi:hypothetical protein EK21DRAFT_110231 [Setomelanomma holmii]|uniref:Uncharacterized protein n=1 Tax=Setomelanomma holmii TaxID=210430 RepID=A0A9P4HFX6_9PLEO|nr:hypothetical protein EK21DRAFT_110231 [Setomelanomma holmii]